MNTDERSDEDLAAAAAREDSDGPACQALLARYQQRVWAVCFRLLGNHEDAQDAAQDVLVQMFMQRTKFGGRSKYSTWVYGIAVRTGLMLRRGRSRRKRREEAAAGDKPTAALPTADSRLVLMELLETLGEQDRAMLVMKFAEGYSYEELAAAFEMSVSACKMRVSRARQKLSEQHS